MRTPQQQIEKFVDEVLETRARDGFYKFGDRRFQTRAVALLAERLLAIEEALATSPALPAPTNGRKKRPPTEWQKFFAKGMKAGKSAAEVSAEWRAR